MAHTEIESGTPKITLVRDVSPGRLGREFVVNLDSGTSLTVCFDPDDGMDVAPVIGETIAEFLERRER